MSWRRRILDFFIPNQIPICRRRKLKIAIETLFDRLMLSQKVITQGYP